MLLWRKDQCFRQAPKFSRRCSLGLFQLWLVVPATFLDIFLAVVLPSSVFSTRRSMGKRENRRPTELCPTESLEWTGESRNLSKYHTPGHPLEVWSSPAFSKIRFTTCVCLGQSFARKTTTPHEILLSLAADAGADTNKIHNNQPHKHFHACLGRASLHFWVDWSTVALLVSLLIRGPFSRTRTQVGCFELHFLIQ